MIPAGSYQVQQVLHNKGLAGLSVGKTHAVIETERWPEPGGGLSLVGHGGRGHGDGPAPPRLALEVAREVNRRRPSLDA